jgi:hypothetical protein
MASAAPSDYWRGANIDRGKLADSLPPLGDTAHEIKSIAAKLGASDDDIYLGRAASETSVKRATLSNYRIVYFATHGLVAGDIRGVGEPSLALTIPKNPSEADDGLLTASEVSQLKLNADWVVLSACNTMAGETPGAEALSGLARGLLLCRQPGAIGLALGGGFEGGRAIDGLDLRHPDPQSLHRPRRSAATGDARVHEGPRAKCLSGLLGAVLGDRRGVGEVSRRRCLDLVWA